MPALCVQSAKKHHHHHHHHYSCFGFLSELAITWPIIQNMCNIGLTINGKSRSKYIEMSRAPQRFIMLYSCHLFTVASHDSFFLTAWASHLYMNQPSWIWCSVIICQLPQLVRGYLLSSSLKSFTSWAFCCQSHYKYIFAIPHGWIIFCNEKKETLEQTRDRSIVFKSNEKAQINSFTTRDHECLLYMCMKPKHQHQCFWFLASWMS